MTMFTQYGGFIDRTSGEGFFQAPSVSSTHAFSHSINRRIWGFICLFLLVVYFSSHTSQVFCANGNWLSFLPDFSPNGLPLVYYPKKSLSLDQTFRIQTYQYLADYNDGEW